MALWCLPAVYATFALLLQKPIPGLDERGEPFKSPPLIKKVIAFPLVLVVLVVLWPWVIWTEWRESRR
jgi:hypothetical protein